MHASSYQHADETNYKTVAASNVLFFRLAKLVILVKCRKNLGKNISNWHIIFP